jgi:uncharacterized protein (DUF1778 family)
MKTTTKSEYLQIRVSKQEKEIIKSSALSAGVDMSAWILQRVLHDDASTFSGILTQFIKQEEVFVFAELHDFLNHLNMKNYKLAVENKPVAELSEFQINYVIAMIVLRAHQLNVSPPNWLNDFPMLKDPFFGTELKSLRLYLLINSPIAFKQRNIYIDSTIGDRV